MTSKKGWYNIVTIWVVRHGDDPYVRSAAPSGALLDC
jgi:hypothetical protein